MPNSAPATAFITKRPHKKSRGGCQTCKTKRVKCDESQPKCNYCEKRNLPCAYINRSARSHSISPDGSDNPQTLTTSSSSSSDGESEDTTLTLGLYQQPAVTTVATAAGHLSKEDLRIMHHWSINTSGSLSIGHPAINILRYSMPQMAFEHDFLLHAMLGISSLHMSHLQPGTQVATQTDIYRFKALSEFRRTVAKLNANSPEYEAALLMAYMLVPLCSKDYVAGEGELTVTRWLVFFRGLGSIISLRSYQALSQTNVAAFFRREFTPLKTTPVLPVVLLNMFKTFQPDDPEFEDLQSYCRALDAISVLYGSLREDGLTPSFFIRVITWPSYVNQKFVDCAVAKKPRALVVLAHYVVFVKLVKGLWWMDGVADPEIRMIAGMVSTEWLEYMEVPLRATLLTEPEEVAALMLAA